MVEVEGSIGSENDDLMLVDDIPYNGKNLCDMPPEIVAQIFKYCPAKSRMNLAHCSKNFLALELTIPFHVVSATIRTFDSKDTVSLHIQLIIEGTGAEDAIKASYKECPFYTKHPFLFLGYIYAHNYDVLARNLFQRVVRKTTIPELYINSDFFLSCEEIQMVRGCKDLTLEANNEEDMVTCFKKFDTDEFQHLHVVMDDSEWIRNIHPQITKAKLLNLTMCVTEEVFMSITANSIAVTGENIDEQMLHNFVKRWANGEGPENFKCLAITDTDNIDFEKVIDGLDAVDFDEEMEMHNVSSRSATLCREIMEDEILFVVTGSTDDDQLVIKYPETWV
ncbi:unnamed protein product [Caenorhabditis bovis]|uniref:F-box domain-containing protein n=1 Tax=Caenorhabditis bovis TaxID=2654633 RepID=A0A8S1EGF9_9PELO|nr:unnamed protein product [Caenorhabditis bovis]